MTSVKDKALYFLRSVPVASKYQVRDEVKSWGKNYDEQTIDRELQRMVKREVLRSKKINGVMYYKVNDS